MAAHICYCLLIAQLVAYCVCAPTNNYTLKSVYVVFRHGDRTPDPSESYKTDPYANHTFFPFGRGGLINQGKLRLYNLGNSLRQRYDKFLGDHYWPADVKARSTPTSRTKMSLELVLASLYPPKRNQVWNKDLKWQPIPYYAPPEGYDIFFGCIHCPNYLKLTEKVRNSPLYKKMLSPFNEVMNKLSKHTGQRIKDSLSICFLYYTFLTQSSLNLPLPDWVQSYFSREILNATILEYDIRRVSKLKRLCGGLPMRKILDDMSIVTNEKVLEKPKIHLQAGHEYNIVGIMQLVNLWDRTIPEYTSAVIFELYEMNLKYFIKLAYYKGIPSEFKDELQIPGCDKFCPLEDFKKMFDRFIPIDAQKECFGSQTPEEWSDRISKILLL